MESGLLAQILAANAAYAERFDRQGLGAQAAPPRLAAAVLTCMDARIDPLAALGFEAGDVHVLRNAGGRASDDALRSLLLSCRLLGVREILVVHHTDCGTATPEPELRVRLRASGADPGEVDLLAIEDPQATLAADVERIRSWPLLPRSITVTGLTYDVATGRLHPLESQQRAAKLRAREDSNPRHGG